MSDFDYDQRVKRDPRYLWTGRLHEHGDKTEEWQCLLYLLHRLGEICLQHWEENITLT